MLINSTNKDYSYYLDIKQELVPVDVTILLCLLLLIVTIIIYQTTWCINEWKSPITEHLSSSKSWTRQVQWCAMWLNSDIIRKCIALWCINSFFLLSSLCRTTILWPAGVQIDNKFLGLRVTVPSWLLLWFWQGWLVRRIIRGKHYVLLHVSDNKGRLVDLVLIANPEMNRRPGSSAPPEPPLYPNVDKYWAWRWRIACLVLTYLLTGKFM